MVFVLDVVHKQEE